MQISKESVRQRIVNSSVVAEEWEVHLSDGLVVPFRVIPIDVQGRLGSILGYHKEAKTPPDELGPIMMRAAIRWAVLDGNDPVFDDDDQVRDWLRTLAAVDQQAVAEAANDVARKSGLTVAEEGSEDDASTAGKASSKTTGS